MTIHDLKNEVEALGFSGLSPDDNSLACTINRALRMIHTCHPKTKRGELGFFPEDAILKRDVMVGEGAEVSLSVPAGNLTMTLQGEGEYTVRYGKKSLGHSFSCIPSNVNIEFPEDGELIFSAESHFSAWNIRAYRRSAFPFDDALTVSGDYLTLDLRKVFPDLVYLLRTPRDISGKEIMGIVVNDASHVSLPKSYRGVISFDYRAAADEITEDSDDGDKIDISDELTPLLPLLVTYFLWLDDEPDIAKEYLSEYEKLSANIKRLTGGGASPYVDVYRWS